MVPSLVIVSVFFLCLVTAPKSRPPIGCTLTCNPPFPIRSNKFIRLNSDLLFIVIIFTNHFITRTLSTRLSFTLPVTPPSVTPPPTTPPSSSSPKPISSSPTAAPIMHPLGSESVPHEDMNPFNQNSVNSASLAHSPYCFRSSNQNNSLISPHGTNPELQPQSKPCTSSPQNASVNNTPRQNNLNVVITGGSSGIGAEIVHKFAKAGHHVFFTYQSGCRRSEQLNAIYPKHTSYAHLDQADVSSVAKLSQTVSEWAGPQGVDILINNAALGSGTVDKYVEQSPDTSSPTSTSESMEKERQQSLSESARKMMERAAHSEALMKVNALGPLYVTEALEDQLKKAAFKTPDSNAVIIFVGSVGGGSTAVFPEYCAADLMSKAAMTYLSKHIAAKYVQQPIDVMCISPGATETDMFRESTLSKVSDPVRFIQSMPKRRLIQPEEVASTVYWLSTECPKGIFHGANLDASMGLAVRPGLQTETELYR